MHESPVLQERVSKPQESRKQPRNKRDDKDEAAADADVIALGYNPGGTSAVESLEC